MKRTPLAALAGLAATILAVPLVVTTAAWNDAEWVHAAPLGTLTIDCESDEDFDSASGGRFLGGSLLGTDLDAIAQLAPLELGVADGVAAVSPSGANNLGSPPPRHTFANPLQISALGGIVGLDLTGLGVGLPVGSAGAVNQWTSVSSTGDAAGASGLVNDSGGVLVSPTTPSSELPQPATITLDTLLPAVSGIQTSQLRVGAVAASSTLDGCEALRSSVWGDGSVSGVVRDYGIASLGLRLQSPLVSALTTQVNAGVVTIGTAVNSLTGPTGLIGSLLRSSIQASLPLGLAAAATTGTVTITGLNLAGAVSTLLTTPLTDGVVTIDLATGHIDVDLAALLGGPPHGLNDLAPNTELVLNADVLNPLTARVGAMLDAWTQQITSALTSAVRTATLAINLSSTVSLLSGGVQVLRTDITLNASLGAVLDGTAVLSVSTTVLGLSAVLNPLLAPLGINLAGLQSLIGGLGSSLLTAIANLITTTVLARVNDLGATLAATSASIVTAVGGILAALPTVLSLMVNVQPDQPGAPPGLDPTPPTDRSTGRFDVTALRIGLAPHLTPTGVAHISFATASAGPVALPAP